MTRSQIRSAEALKRVRERLRELDREADQGREARRERIAAASASAMVALARYDKAVEGVDDASAEVGTAVRMLLAEDVDFYRVVALLELDVAEVRRFSRAAFGQGGAGEGQRLRRDGDSDELSGGGQAAASGRDGRTPDWLRQRGTCCGR